MTSGDFSTLKILGEVWWVIVAAIGGVARYLSEYMAGQRQFILAYVLANIFVSGFSGYMTASVVGQFYPQWAVAAAGIGGYLGVEVFALVEKIVKKRLGLDSSKGDTHIVINVDSTKSNTSER